MFTLLVVAVLASSATCTFSQNIKQNSPTYVPRRCFLDKANGPCRDYSRNYFFNVTAGHCQTFLYGGCGGNWNRFASRSECHRTCTCATPPESGPCRGHLRRWFYSPADGCCRPFIYGGCGGNSNSYASWTECSEMCGYPTADSSWWTWGAQWGNWSSGQASGQGSGQASGSHSANRSYTRNDFMRDWMLWSLLSGGEGFEMENLASVIAQAHILGLGQTMGGARGAGSGFGFGSQMFDQEAANGVGAGWGGGMQGSGMSNLGPAYQTTRPGSFTPLGQIGTMANMMNGEAGEMMANANAAWNQLAAAGLVGGAQGWGGQSQGSFSQGASGQSNWGFGGQSMSSSQRQGRASMGAGMSGAMRTGMSGVTGAGMSGQGSWRSQGQGSFNQGSGGLSGWGEGRWMHGEGRWKTGGSGINDFVDIGSGALGYRGSGITGDWNSRQTGSTSTSQGVGNTAIEILHLISQIGRGALGPSDLINLGKRYGAVSSAGNVDINLLATRMVSELQGPRGAVNMARLKGVAQRLGALDNNGNINIPLIIKGISETLSSGRFRDSLGEAGFPRLDEFNWLGSNKGLVGSSSGAGGSGMRGTAGGGSGGGGSLLLGGGSTGSRIGEAGLGGGSPSVRGISGGRLGISGVGGGPSIQGGAVGGIRGAIRGLMGGTGAGGAGGAGGMGSRGFGGAAGGASGTAMVQAVNVAGGSRRMGSYGKK